METENDFFTSDPTSLLYDVAVARVFGLQLLLVDAEEYDVVCGVVMSVSDVAPTIFLLSVDGVL